MTSLHGNTTAYQYYRLAGVSGSHSSNPDVAPIAFRIDDNIDTTVPSYFNACGAGDRTAVITVTTSQASGHNNIFQGRFGASDPFMSLLVDNLNRIDGGGQGALWFGVAPPTVSGKWIQWQFPSPQIIDELRWFQETPATHGIWQLQGSNDGITFANVGSPATLGGSYDGIYGYSVFGGPAGNTTAYIYYRLAGVSGNYDGAPFVFESAFRIASPPAGTPGRFTCTANPLAQFLPEEATGRYTATASPLMSFTPGMIAFKAFPLATFTPIANAYAQMGFAATASPEWHFDGVVRAVGFVMTAHPRLSWFTTVGQSARCASGPGARARNGIPTNYVF
jgi:hypothetical protein